MEPNPLLVAPEWLAERLDDPTLRILDATVWLELDPAGGPPKLESARSDWAEAHIPGSAYVDLLELSDPDSPLPFMLPPAERFAEGMSAAGVGPGTHVIACDRTSGMWATRLWWMLRAFGFDAVSVLDGGWTAWQAAGLPTSSDPPAYPKADFVAKPRSELVASKEDVAAAIGDGAVCTINALGPEQFRGEVPSAPGRAGRIPGSVNVPTATLVDPETNRLVPPERIRERFAEAGALDRERVVTYCGGGIAATFDAFALALIGRDDVAVYDGSMVEWVSDADAPLEVG